MSKVVGLRDKIDISNPAEPDEFVVAAIENLLTLAKAGQITGIAYATHYYDGAGTNHFVGRVTRGTVGHLFATATRISLGIDKEP